MTSSQCHETEVRVFRQLSSLPFIKIIDEDPYNVIYLCPIILMRCSTCVLDWCSDRAESSRDGKVKHSDFP